jgi:hypothetical protein
MGSNTGSWSGGNWTLAGVPDATFFNPKSGLVHVAIGDPGLIQSIDPRTGASMQFIIGADCALTDILHGLFID